MFNQQFRIRGRMLDHVIKNATHFRGSMMMPVAFRETRNMRAGQIHGISLFTVHNQLLFSIVDKQGGFKREVQHQQ